MVVAVVVVSSLKVKMGTFISRDFAGFTWFLHEEKC